MAVVLDERYNSPRHVGGKDPRWEKLYVATGSTDELEVRAAVLNDANTPPFYDGLPRQNIEVEHIEGESWDVIVPYSKRESQEPEEPPVLGDSEYEFDLSTETARVRQSLATINGYSSALVPTVPDFEGAVNVQEDSVEGVDVLVPRAQFSETHWIDGTLVTPAYRKTVAGLVGTMNNAGFRGYAAHEVLLVGCRGRFKDGDILAQLTFTFAVSFNRTDIVVGAMISIVKDGWDYLWVRYGKQVDAVANAVVHYPENAYVERVYREGNFSLLGIGT